MSVLVSVESFVFLAIVLCGCFEQGEDDQVVEVDAAEDDESAPPGEFVDQPGGDRGPHEVTKGQPGEVDGHGQGDTLVKPGV